MIWIAAAIVFAVVLNLVDRNHKWGAFWKLTGSLVLFAVCSVGFLWYDDYKTTQISACGAKVRAAYPSAADPFTTDLTLGKKVIAKYPTCDTVKWVAENMPPFVH